MAEGFNCEKSKSVESVEPDQSTLMQSSLCAGDMVEQQKKAVGDAFSKAHEALNEREKELIDQINQLSQLIYVNFTASPEFVQECRRFGRVEGVVKQIFDFSQVQGLVKQIFDDLRGPEGVIINKKGEVIVAESEGNAVTIINGDERCRFGGANQAVFDFPSGLALDKDGNLVVTNCQKNCIQKFTGEGQLLKEVAFKERYPCGIAYNSTNNHFYVGSDGHYIQVLNSDLENADDIENIGEKEHNDDDKRLVKYPRQIVCDSAGNVYVADRDNHRIRVFTATGEQLRTFGEKKLDSPWGIAIDSNGRIYVSEYGNHCISVFTPEGNFITSFGKKGDRPGEFKNPNGLAMDENGVLYVCDFKNNRVQCFDTLRLYRQPGN